MQYYVDYDEWKEKNKTNTVSLLVLATFRQLIMSQDQRNKEENTKKKNFAMKTKSLTSIAFSGTTTMLRRMKCHQSLGMRPRIANVNLKHLIIRYSMYMCTSVCMDVWMCVCMRSVQRRFISLLSKKFARKVFLQMFHIVGNVFKLICNKIIHL